MLTLSGHLHEGCMVISISGDLACETVEEAEAYIMHDLLASARDGTGHLILSLSGVTFLDSAGVNLLAKVRFAVRSQRGLLSIVAPEGGRPHRTLEHVGLLGHLRVFSSLDQITLVPGPAADPEAGAAEYCR